MKRLSKASFRLSSRDADKVRESRVEQNSPPAMRDLQEFLAEAELGEYYNSLCTKLKVTSIEHLKYVREEDLEDIGMSRPEMRRLKKFYRKEFPQGTFNKLKKALRGGDGSNTNSSSRTLSPSPTDHRSSKNGSPSISAPSTPGRQHPPCRQLIPSDALEFHHTLGEGDFGVVLQATWTVPETGDKLPVAVKKLLRDKVNNGTQTFLKEAAITQDMEHDSIVRLYGVVLDQDQDIMLVTELAPMRSLLECLHDESLRTDLGVPRLCDFAQQVCEGMAYLESKRMVHRDLAARNVLVFTKSQVKISDLGLSRGLGVGQDYYQSSSCTSLKLPIAWCAPECINFLKFTSSSDVWSFGVLMWECFTYGQQPWDEMDTQQILESIDAPACHRLPQPELCTPEFYQTLLSCWSHSPEDRPPFSSLLVQLPQLRPTQVRAIKDYPKPTVEGGYICYKNGDVIVVVDKTPSTNAPAGLVWKGVLTNGAVGLFDPTHVVPFIEPKISPLAVQKTSLARKESGRKSSRKVLRADMISRPQNDLRHTGHIGYDGAVFGDVSFIGNNYDKLPLKVEDGAGSENNINACNSHDSLESPGQNGLQQSWLSRDSLSSQTTVNTEGRQSPSYFDVEDDSLFSDFKMPDMGSSLDFGGSFMDEVLKALDAKEKEVTSTNAGSEDNSYSEVRNEDAPTPVPRGSVKSSVVPPLPSQPPRNDPPPTKEKKQAKVKPMSTSDERIMETALANARELTALKGPGECHSPTVNNEKSHFFNNDDSPGIVSKLRNSLRRSTSPKTERKRTFSDELESKGDIADELTPEAQQAYNILVVKGEGSTSSSSNNRHYNDQMHYPESDMRSGSSDHSRQHIITSSKDQDDSVFAEPNHRSNGTPPRVIPHSGSTSTSSKTHTTNNLNAHPTQTPPHPPSKPLISAPVPQNKPVAITHPTTTSVTNASSPVPAPRPPKAESKKSSSDLPVPKPRPEIQRVEPTIRHTVPDSPPEMEPKSHIPISRKDSSSTSKEKEREDLKKTIEIVRVDDNASIRDRDELSEKNSSTFDRSSNRSSQRSSLDRSDATSENAESERADWEQHSEYSSDGSRPDHRANSSFGSSDRQDSFSNKKQSSSLFEEDLSEPSPQEIMSRLRERRLHRNLDHQRALTGEGSEGSLSSAPSTAPRPRPNAREPQGIPGRTPSMDLEDGGGGEGSDEVDTNPLRMLRGGAIPIRTGRGSAGNHGNTSNQGTRGAIKALRVPALNFSSPLSRLESSPTTLSSSQIQYATIQPETTTATANRVKGFSDNNADLPGNTSQQLDLNYTTTTSVCVLVSSTSTTSANPSSSSSSSSLPSSLSLNKASINTTTTDNDTAADLMLELDRLTSTLMEGDLSKVASAVAGRRTSEVEIRKFTEQGHKIDLTKTIPNSTEDSHNTDISMLDTNNTNVSPVHIDRNNNSSQSSTSNCTKAITSSTSSVVSSTNPQQSPPVIPQRPNLPAVIKMVDTSSVPPRLPPRRTQSLTENPDRMETTSTIQQRQQRTRELRRSNSLEEPDLKPTSSTPPLLPPRVPQPSSRNIPLNSKPRERKFPLLMRPPPPNTCGKNTLPSPTSPTSTSHHHSTMSKSNPISLPERQPIVSSRSSSLLSSSPSNPLSLSSSSSPQHTQLRQSQSVDSHHNHPHHHHHQHSSQNKAKHPSPHGRSFDSCMRSIQSSKSFDLPPTSDISRFISDADSEPTHMLLESPTATSHSQHSQCQVPSLVVNLPSTSDYRDEPTHIPLSWSSSFPSPTCQSQIHSLHGRSNTNNKALNRSISHQPPFVSSRYPSLTDNQSPPADLPPAPPTPSYREKLGLPSGGGNSQKSTAFMRSVSQDTTATKLSSLPGQPPPPLSPRNPNVTSSSFSSGRRRSSSMTNPQHHHHNMPPLSSQHQHPSGMPPSSSSSTHPLVSPLRTHHLHHHNHNHHPPQTVFKYPDTLDNTEDGDDDAFFSEAPSVPHPYSQSPFHPIVSSSSSSSSSNSISNKSSLPLPTTTMTSTSSTTCSHFHSNTKNNIHPLSSSFQIKIISSTTSSSSPHTNTSNDIPPPISPRTTSRGISNPAKSSSLPFSNNIKSSPSPQSTANTSQPALPPRSPIPTTTTSPPISPEASKDPYLHISSASSSPTHAPLPSPNNLNFNVSSSEDDESVVIGRSLSQSPPPPFRFKYVSKTESQSQSSNDNMSKQISHQHQNHNQTRALSSPPPPPTSKITNTSTSSSAVAAAATASSSQPSSSSSSSLLPVSSSSEYGELDLSPAMLASYKNSSTVSYEDLLEFALDSQKNCEEIETLLNIFQNEVTVEECMVALENTRWDVSKATKYIQLKKLLCIGIADVHRCQESLVAYGWDVERAAEALLESTTATTTSVSALPGDGAGSDGLRPSSSLSLSSSARSTSSLASSSSLSLSSSSSSRVSPARNVMGVRREDGGGGGGEFLSSTESSSSSSSCGQSPSSNTNNTNRAPSPETVDV